MTTKKILIGSLIVLYVITVICLPYWVDNFACENYIKDIENDIFHISEIKVLDMLNGCGNVANGNHTYLIVNALFETDLTKENIKNKISDAYDVIPFEVLHLETKTSKQFSKYVIDNTKAYFVVVYAKSAPFWYIDLRGH